MCDFPMYRYAPESGDRLPGIRLHWSVNSSSYIWDQREEAFTKMLATVLHERGFQSLDFQEIPCGRCVACRLNYSKEWAQRCMAESSANGGENWFITLTYDDEHLLDCDVRKTISRESGDVGFFADLKKEHLQKFMKDLRAAIKYKLGCDNVRFFACGEYGPKNSRPHFHAILFNCPLPDLSVHHEVNLNGKQFTYLKSEFLSKIWKRGFVCVGKCEFESVAYVARYVMKKTNGLDEESYLKACENLGVKPLHNVFLNMSRRPGIGFYFYEANKGVIYEYDRVTLPDGKSLKPCKYFDKLYDSDYDVPALPFATIKELRKAKAERCKLEQALALNKKGLSLADEEKRSREVRDRKLQLLTRSKV